MSKLVLASKLASGVWPPPDAISRMQQVCQEASCLPPRKQNSINHLLANQQVASEIVHALKGFIVTSIDLGIQVASKFEMPIRTFKPAPKPKKPPVAKRASAAAIAAAAAASSAPPTSTPAPSTPPQVLRSTKPLLAKPSVATPEPVVKAGPGPIMPKPPKPAKIAPPSEQANANPVTQPLEAAAQTTTPKERPLSSTPAPEPVQEEPVPEPALEPESELTPEPETPLDRDGSDLVCIFFFFFYLIPTATTLIVEYRP